MGPRAIMWPEGFRAFLNRNLGSDLARQINTPGSLAAHPSTPIGQFRYQPRPRWLLKPEEEQLLTAVRRQDGTPVPQSLKPSNFPLLISTPEFSSSFPRLFISSIFPAFLDCLHTKAGLAATSPLRSAPQD